MANKTSIRTEIATPTDTPIDPSGLAHAGAKRSQPTQSATETPQLMVAEIEELGMPLKLYKWKSCTARVGEGEDWATIYFLESQERNKGHATELCKILKHVYRGKKFGGTIALNPAMKRVYEKSGVAEYEEA